jgi:ligand-binding SRPBCC domain-containing protein
MKVHTLKVIQNIPASPQEAWNFFSNPANLPVITPGGMRLRIISKDYTEIIYPGQILEYKVSPVFKIPLYWMTAITQVSPGRYFVDEQRKGPYKRWHHEHHFKAVPNGVEMTDRIQYQLPLRILGEIVNSLFIKQELKKIFEYRFKKVEELFGPWPGQTFTWEFC